MYRSLAVRLLLVAGFILPTAALLGAAPASATGTIACSVSHTTSVSPGLEQPAAGDIADTIQTYKITATLSGCTGATGITGGTATGTLKSISPQMPTCSDMSKNGTTFGSVGGARVQVKWNNNHASSVQLTGTIDAAQHAQFSGTVTAGQFKADKVGGGSSFTFAQGNCSDTSPVTKLSGSGTFTLHP